MSKIFQKVYYHLVWRTKKSEPLITPEIEKVLYPFLENKSKRFDCLIHAIGGIEDHIHIAISIPPSEAVSDIIGKLKGSSSYFLNMELKIAEHFSWQNGFGVLTFAERDLSKIVHYIANQKEHHRLNTINKVMETTDDN